ncbi:radical SAM protein [Clostridium fermenticellae]|uniref:Radical SAM protein n=1 Tax=Clostridium fermenticellae TaxID=2068654 RepID=A0A386H377_9CLOT|nr:radical SAM protein [Clostridium fermenticellae]AYD40038.1 radical SAM protein [Clostridium fermenticellae]
MSKGHYIIPIFVPHEGCPHNCVFCNQNTITASAQNVQNVDAKFTRNIIEEYLKTMNHDESTIEVSFFGGTFTAIDINKQNELLEVAKYYKDGGYIDYIHLSTRPDYIDDDILKNLKKYSVDVIELGVQSLDDEVLKKSGRGHSAKDVRIASELIRQYGFCLGHQMMLGLPGDSFEKDIESIKMSIAMKPDIYRIYPALVIKDTPMEKMYNQNIYKPYELYEAVNICRVLYIMLLASNINVIRIGLQPTTEINVGGELIAGPFHPAFRELVEGRIYNECLYSKIAASNSDDVIVYINSRDISKLYADKKKFFNDTMKQIKTKNVKIIQDDSVMRGKLIFNMGKECKKVSIYKYIIKKYKEGNENIL